MNKTEFLNELEKRIRVLDKNEINDILGEYSQHIDMRRESGLSEEEAIKDFGDMDELAAEILEAYHVNPEYDRELDRQEGIGKAAEALAGEISSSVGGPLKKFLKKCRELVIKIFLWIKALVSGLFKKKEENAQSPEENGETSIHEPKKKSIFHKGKKEKEAKPQKTRSFRDSAGKQLKKTKGRCRKLLGGIFTLCVSAAAVFCLIPVTIAMVFLVFGLGISVIMLFTGYPLAGVTITLLGASVAAVALWLLLTTFIGRWYRKSRENSRVIRDGWEEKRPPESSIEVAEKMAEDIEEAADEVCDEIYAQDTKGKEFRTAENENHDISPEEDQAEDNGAGEVLGNDMVKVGERYISREYVIDEKEAEKEDGK